MPLAPSHRLGHEPQKPVYLSSQGGCTNQANNAEIFRGCPEGTNGIEVSPLVGISLKHFPLRPPLICGLVQADWLDAALEEGEVASEEPRSSVASSRRPARRTSASRPTAHRTPSGDGNNDKETTRPEFERAEEVLDNLAKRVGGWTQVASTWAINVYGRAREGAEDILAEAQDLRRRRRS